MESAPKETWHAKYLRRLLNNRLIAIVAIVVVVVVGVGALTGALNTAWDFIQSVLHPDREELRKEYCELLRPLSIELDRTKAAFDLWNQKDLSLESETIRDGNLKARALLREKGHLVPDSLRNDQQKLIFHYDRWLEEYDRVRVRRSRDPEQPFVFVYSFPRESEQAFREHMAHIEAKLGGGARCR